LIDGPADGNFNMAVDEVLLDFVSQSSTTPITFLRFYQWKEPTLSIGYSQKARKVVDFTFCKSRGIQIIRRPTGGKAVLHDQELTYSLVSNDVEYFPIHDISGTYQLIAEALSSGLKKMGIQTVLAGSISRIGSNFRDQSYPQFACFAVANHHEILWKNRKLIGSAQRRTQQGFLQHGSVLIEFDSKLLAGALGLPQLAEIESRVATLRECLGYKPQVLEIIPHFILGFARRFGVIIEKSILDEQLTEEIQGRMLARRMSPDEIGAKSA
jgi:lipoate-protein ligase A